MRALSALNLDRFLPRPSAPKPARVLLDLDDDEDDDDDDDYYGDDDDGVVVGWFGARKVLRNI